MLLKITKRIPLSWEGWTLSVLENWRPFKIENGHTRGSMLIGDADEPTLLVRWWRPGRRFHPSKYFHRQAKELGAPLSEHLPGPPGLDETAWIEEFTARNGTSQAAWYGYSQAGGMVVEAILNRAVPKEMLEEITENVLPSLQISAKEEDTAWAMYNLSFVCPAGFVLRRHHLYPGNIALEFTGGAHETLMLRQVYPADLALQRRTSDLWLKQCPFKQHRKLRPGAGTVALWQREEPNPLAGMRMRGWKRLPMPLGWCAPRFMVGILATDETLNRLCIVEHMGPRRMSDLTAAQAIENMNRGISVLDNT